MLPAARHPSSSRAHDPPGVPSLLHGLLEPGGLLRSASLLEPANGDLRLPAQGRAAGSRPEARVGTETIPGADEVVHVALDLSRVDTVGVSGLDRQALIEHIRDGGDDPGGIALIRSHLRFVAVAGQRKYRRADDNRKRADTTKGGEAVQHLAALFIRPFHRITD
jgi:hypothetical protein